MNQQTLRIDILWFLGRGIALRATVQRIIHRYGGQLWAKAAAN